MREWSTIAINNQPSNPHSHPFPTFSTSKFCHHTSTFLNINILPGVGIAITNITKWFFGGNYHTYSIHGASGICNSNRISNGRLVNAIPSVDQMCLSLALPYYGRIPISIVLRETFYCCTNSPAVAYWGTFTYRMYSYYFGHTMIIPCFGGINHFSEQILVIQQFAMGNHHFYPLVN